jgi:hypothetical protein
MLSRNCGQQAGLRVFLKLSAQGGASRSLIVLFRYMPLDSAIQKSRNLAGFRTGLARHETGQQPVEKGGTICIFRFPRI